MNTFRNLFSKVSIIVFLIMVYNSCKKDDKDSPLDNGATILFNPNLTYGTMTDLDGNIYKTITIGTQTWMAENLRTTTYRNGDAIPEVTDQTEWGNLSTGAYCNYLNTKNADTIETFGRLYNWYSVDDSRNIAPAGWHVPSVDDWNILISFLGNMSGDKMKETGTVHWEGNNEDATNESGFTALPGGCRLSNNAFSGIDAYAFFWSSTFHPEDAYSFSSGGYCYVLDYKLSYCEQSINPEIRGFSVRCVKD